MPFGNYVVIQGDSRRKIEMGANGEATSVFRKEFELDGPDSGGSTIFMVMVQGLTGDATAVNVDINGKHVGKIHPNPNGGANSWFTQILHFSASEGNLRPNAKDDGTVNVLEIPGQLRKNETAENTNNFGRMYIQNLVCFYKQAA